MTRLTGVRNSRTLFVWVRTPKLRQQKLKRAAQQVRTLVTAGRFLFGEDTPLKTDQLGAAGWGLRCGIRLPAAQGTLYSYKGQGFLPGRTGLNPLRRNTLGDQGFRGEALLPPAGDGDYKGL